MATMACLQMSLNLFLLKKKQKKLPQLGYIIAVKSCNSPAQEDIKYANKNSGYLLK